MKIPMAHTRYITMLLVVFACNSTIHAADDMQSSKPTSSLGSSISEIDKPPVAPLDLINTLYKAKKWEDVIKTGKPIAKDLRQPSDVRAIIWSDIANVYQYGGNGVNRNSAKALKSYKKALNIPELPAYMRAINLFLMVNIYLIGDAFVDKNDRLALSCCDQALKMEALTLTDRAKTHHIIAHIHFSGGRGIAQNYAIALKNYTQALAMQRLSPLNCVKALIDVACIHRTGGSGIAKDLSQALSKLREALEVPNGASHGLKVSIEKEIGEIEQELQAYAGTASSSSQSGALQAADRAMVRTAALLGRPIIGASEHLELYLATKAKLDDLKIKLGSLDKTRKFFLCQISTDCLKQFLILDDIMHTPDNGVEKNFAELREYCTRINEAFDHLDDNKYAMLKQEVLYRIARMWYSGGPGLEKSIFRAKCIISHLKELLRFKKPTEPSLFEDYLDLNVKVFEEEAPPRADSSHAEEQAPCSSAALAEMVDLLSIRRRESSAFTYK